jgi:hypothetical protein
MGRSYTPKYRVEYRDNTMNRLGTDRILSYDAKRYGKPTDAKAEDLRRALNKSFNVGGVNWHVSEAAGVVVSVNRLRIINQRSGQVVAESNAPMFEVV